MHACGHDAHVAMLLGASRILQHHKKHLQPADEGGGGARRMVDKGALENLDAIFGLHVAAHMPTNIVASRPGPLLARSGFFEADITGKGVARLSRSTISTPYSQPLMSLSAYNTLRLEKPIHWTHRS